MTEHVKLRRQHSSQSALAGYKAGAKEAILADIHPVPLEFRSQVGHTHFKSTGWREFLDKAGAGVV